MNLILFDSPKQRKTLLPFTYTRPIADIRIGIVTIKQKWEHYMDTNASYLTENYLAKKFTFLTSSNNLYVNGGVCPNQELLAEILKLNDSEILVDTDTVIAFRSSVPIAFTQLVDVFSTFTTRIQTAASPTIINHYWDIFKNNSAQIRSDFSWIKTEKQSQPLDDEHTKVYHLNNIFVGQGTKIRAAILNAENGPIYIGANCEIQEGAMIRGPFALGDGSTINMGTKIRGDVTIGPHCKVGGEVSNSVFFGYSNKSHDGFVGNSVIGEWCNLGADTNTSNLKNNYSSVKVWSYDQKDYVDTGLIFCGLAMGDHSKCGINTMFNTGTVVGVNANIFGGNFPAKYIPSFAWGMEQNSERFLFQKAIEVAEKVLERRSVKLTEEDISILWWIYDQQRE